MYRRISSANRGSFTPPAPSVCLIFLLLFAQLPWPVPLVEEPRIGHVAMAGESSEMWRVAQEESPEVSRVEIKTGLPRFTEM